MDIDSSKDGQDMRVALHPLVIVHMSDQYTRISCGGSPLDKDAPVVGLLFGLLDDDGKASSPGPAVQIRDADDIPVEVSDTSTLQVDLHNAVFPQHKVVGWYRVAVDSDEPTAQDLATTQTLKAHYAPADQFCFCLLQVQGGEDEKMKVDEGSPADTLSKDLPINLFCLQDVEDTTILVGIENWQLETSEVERIAVERVMREKPSEVDDGSPSQNPYVLEAKAIQHSLKSMKDRVQVLVSYLDDVKHGKIPVDRSLLRQVHGLVCSLGPLSTLAASTNDGEETGVEMFTHLALVAKTVNVIQSYTEKFRLIHEAPKEIRRAF